MTRIGAIRPSDYTEKQWEKQVTDLLVMYAWDWWYHVTRAKYSAWGWPDLIAVRRRDRRILIVENKSQQGQVSPEQGGVLELLLDVAGGGYVNSRAKAGHEGPGLAGYARLDVELWRPGDIDRVVEVLR